MVSPYNLYAPLRRCALLALRPLRTLVACRQCHYPDQRHRSHFVSHCHFPNHNTDRIRSLCHYPDSRPCRILPPIVTILTVDPLVANTHDWKLLRSANSIGCKSTASNVNSATVSYLAHSWESPINISLSS